VRILCERDMRRLESVVRKVERMAEINQTRRMSVSPGGGGGGDGPDIPAGRVAIATADTYLTRTDHLGKIIYCCGDNIPGSGPAYLYLPSSPKVGETYMICFKPTSEPMSIHMANLDHVIVASPPVLASYEADDCDCVAAYWFDYVGGSGTPYKKESLEFKVVGNSGDMVSWVFITYTGKKIQISTTYTDTDGDGEYSPIPIHPIIWRTCTEWSIWRCTGAVPEINNYPVSHDPMI
jgi:hypothetical protein